MDSRLRVLSRDFKKVIFFKLIFFNFFNTVISRIFFSNKKHILIYIKIKRKTFKKQLTLSPETVFPALVVSLSSKCYPMEQSILTMHVSMASTERGELVLCLPYD